ncbi:MAG: zinc-ribbon and DUF3426 domain-containing protein [Pelomonas sp.]|nr:zinc-ribbon and DUF3426 domain-containing protein [Roseateles sp.]
MSLATRCTACGTIFRVVQDQLRVSEGWVRCGRCAEVFDARQQLFDMEREAPPAWTGSQRMPLAPEPAPAPSHAPEPVAAPAAHFEPAPDYAAAPPPAPSHAEPPASAYAPTPPAAAVPAPAAELAAELAAARDSVPDDAGASPAPHYDAAPGHASSRIEPSFDAAPPARAEPVWDEPASAKAGEPPATPGSFATAFEASLHAEPRASRLAAADAEADAGPASMLAADAADAAPPQPANPARKKPRARPDAGAEGYVPSFMRHAQERERLRRPSVRVGLGVATGLLGALLVVQAAHHWRDAIAAAYPPARGALEALCRVGACRVEPWRRIDVLSVENTALAQAGGAANQYQLSVALRNKAGYDVALPWIDLSLTDANGALVARRALAPADFRVGLDGKPASLAAGSEQSLQVVLNTGNQKVSGYTVEIFNP